MVKEWWRRWWWKWRSSGRPREWAAVGLSVGCKKKKRNERGRRREWLYNGRRYNIILLFSLSKTKENAQKEVVSPSPNAALHLHLGQNGPNAGIKAAPREKAKKLRLTKGQKS